MTLLRIIPEMKRWWLKKRVKFSRSVSDLFNKSPSAVKIAKQNWKKLCFADFLERFFNVILRCTGFLWGTAKTWALCSGICYTTRA